MYYLWSKLSFSVHLVDIFLYMEKFVPHSIDNDPSCENRSPGDVKVGFSSSSADMRERLDLVKLLVKHKASTFFFRIGGVPMSGSALEEGDIIVIRNQEIEVATLERTEHGLVIINGGEENGGYDLYTDDSGVYYEMGHAWNLTCYEI